MQNTLRNIHTKLDSNWSSSLRGEFRKIVKDDDGCKEIAKGHLYPGDQKGVSNQNIPLNLAL